MYHYENNLLHVDDISLVTIAEKFGTPCYVYSYHAITTNYHAFYHGLSGIPHRIGYAIKANSNIAILKILAKLGANFDIVSLGELERVLAAGGDANKIIFSGVGKQIAEINRALDVNIHCFNVESAAELERIQQLAQQKNKIANIALRINPNIDAKTHPYIATGLHENKFGIEIADAVALLDKIKQMPNIKLIGITCHIGSQITSLAPFLASIDKVLEFITQNHLSLEHINIGGGLGIRYQNENPPSIAEYTAAIKNKFAHTPCEIIVEPGRAIIANAGLLLMRIEYLKTNAQKNFAIVDAAMNDYMRPSLYQAWQNIIPAVKNDHAAKVYDIVGPVCESGDFLGKDRLLSIKQGNYLALTDAGAYGFCMSSNYNTRPRIAEVLIKDNEMTLIRKRETLQDILATEIF